LILSCSKVVDSSLCHSLVIVVPHILGQFADFFSKFILMAQHELCPYGLLDCGVYVIPFNVLP
jgi:hypothetical protein